MTSAAPFLSRYRDMLGLFVLMTAVSLNMLLLSAIAPVLSTIARHFGTGGGAALRAQSIITLSGIGIMLGGPLAGWIGDRIGLRRLLVLSLALYGLMGSGGLYLESAAALLGSGFGRGFLRDGVAGEADGQGGGGDKALDHGRPSLCAKAPAAFYRKLPRLE